MNALDKKSGPFTQEARTGHKTAGTNRGSACEETEAGGHGGANCCRRGKSTGRERRRPPDSSSLVSPGEEGEVSGRDAEGSSPPATCTVIVLYSVTRITAGEGMQMRKPKNWLPKKKKSQEQQTSKFAKVRAAISITRD